MHTRCIIKTNKYLQGVFVKIGDFIKFDGFLVEFLENRRSRENQKPPEIARKVTFLSLAFYNAPSLHTAERITVALHWFRTG